MKCNALLLATFTIGFAANVSQAQPLHPQCVGYSEAVNWPKDRDAITAAPLNHKVRFENDQIRILEVIVLPGTRELNHHHQWPSVMIIDSRPPYVNYDQDGKVFTSSIQSLPNAELPTTIKLPPQAEHAIENKGNEPFHAIRIEYKTLCSKP